MTGLIADLSDWVDPGAVRSMVQSVRAAFAAAPLWAGLGLLVMLTVAVVTGILRVTSSLVGRLVAMGMTAAVVGLVFWGSTAGEFLSRWLP